MRRKLTAGGMGRGAGLAFRIEERRVAACMERGAGEMIGVGDGERRGSWRGFKRDAEPGWREARRSVDLPLKSSAWFARCLAVEEG